MKWGGPRVARTTLLLLAVCGLAACATPPPVLISPPAAPAPTLPPVETPLRGTTLADLAAAARDYRPAVFGSVEAPLPSRADEPAAPWIGQWSRILAWRQGAGRSFLECARTTARCSNGRAAEWAAIVKSAAGQSLSDQLQIINRSVNRTSYRLDDEVFGVSDYWATPDQFLGLAGDCEDFAIAKYLALRQLGLPASALRIVVLTDTIRNSIHAVLAVSVGGETVILDCLSDEIFTDSLYLQYVPHYSVSETGRFEHFGRSAVPFVAPPAA